MAGIAVFLSGQNRLKYNESPQGIPQEIGMSSEHSGLSDALRQMADNEPDDQTLDGQGGQAAARPGATRLGASASGDSSPAEPWDDDDDLVPAVVEDESGEIVGEVAEPAAMTDAADFTAPPMPRVQMPGGSSVSRSRIKHKPKGDGLKAFAVPIVLAVGLMLLAPGIWALLVLTGAYQSEQEGATQMAMMMLISWPISFCLLAAGAVMFMQIRAGKK